MSKNTNIEGRGLFRALESIIWYDGHDEWLKYLRDDMERHLKNGGSYNYICPFDHTQWHTEQHTIFMLLVGMFGDWGTSIRGGWIEDIEGCIKFIEEICKEAGNKMEEQIEEMARDVTASIVWDSDGYATVDCLATAKKLHLKGYRKQSEWISVEERLPEPEKDVLVLAVKKCRTKEGCLEIPVITIAMHEDGTMSTDDSCWSWNDIDFIYDEENDVQYIPEGWWEYSQYNEENECGPVTDRVTHWMPLPEPPKMEGGAG